MLIRAVAGETVNASNQARITPRRLLSTGSVLRVRSMVLTGSPASSQRRGSRTVFDHSLKLSSGGTRFGRPVTW